MKTTNLNILTNTDNWSFVGNNLVFNNNVLAHTPDLIEYASNELEVLKALDEPMPCGHLVRYAVSSDEGTSYCALCELEELNERYDNRLSDFDQRIKKMEDKFCDTSDSIADRRESD